MTANQAMFPTKTMSRILGVSRSGYYAWRDRSPSARSIADAALTDRIKAIHADSRATYGAPRIHAELVDEGVQVGRKRIERLMKATGIAGVSRRKAARTTFRDERVRPACDLVDRNFYADAPDQLWVADITYIPTWAGFLYLAVVLDAFSRRIVGWAMGHSLKAQLVLDALNMALTQRRPADVIHHSDQGSQYTSVAFGFSPDFPNELQFDDAHGRFCYKNQCIIIITPGEARVTRRVNPGPPIYGSISTVASSLNSMVPRLRQTLDCSPTGSLTMPLA